MKYTYVIWDFNGTIMDDVEIGIESVNVLLRKRGLATLSNKSEYQKVFGFPIYEYYKRLGFDFEKESYEDVAVEWVKEYTDREAGANTVKGVCEMLSFFKSRGVKQVIISACEKNMLLRNAKNLRVAEYFDEILGIDDIYASSKLDIALEWKKTHEDEKLLFIGDTDHDYSVAKAIGADCVLVAEGHQAYQSLKSFAEGAFVLERMVDIKKIVD